MSTSGTTLLLRHDLRRDRVVIPAWVSVLALMTFASASATGSLFAQMQDRISIATAVNEQPGLVALYGPILDPRSAGELAMSKLTVLYALFSAALYGVISATDPSIDTSKMPPTPSRSDAVMPYLSLMAACKLEA